MGKQSTPAGRAACAALFAAAMGASPLYAQQPEPALHEQLIDGVRSFLGRLFGGESGAPAEAQPPAPAAGAPEQVPPASASPVVAIAAPAAQAPSLSLLEAVVRGDYEGTLRLLDQGSDIEVRDPGSGASPLHYAVMKGRMPIVELLLARGADVNSRTRNGTTPLHTASLYARKEIAERLLQKNADMNAVSNSGATPLALAAAAKNHPIAEMLRSRGAK